LKLGVEEYIHPNTGFNRLPSVYEIDTDEKAYTLVELNLSPALGGLLHRFQIIIVWRDGQRCQYIEDMGVAELWPSGPKCIQSASHTDAPPEEWVHCVSELKDLANELREIDMEKILGPEHEDLVEGFHNRVDEFFLNKKRVSVSGPLVSIERG
jgi:hypothetical protein|tara:strand:+ start:12917 stop:13378 length:462 start_codon:yes stop_codon:yes gene_type:complete